MYHYRKKRLWICEECGEKTEFLGYKNGKYVCGKCDHKEEESVF